MRTFVYSLSNFQIYSIILTVITMLYIALSKVIYLITGSFYLSPVSTVLPLLQPSLTPLPATNPFSVSMSPVPYLFFFLSNVIQSWNYMCFMNSDHS